jgi:pilus assembly protein CpaF
VIDQTTDQHERATQMIDEPVAPPTSQELQEELGLLLRSGRMRDAWRLPVAEALPRLGLPAAIADATWAGVDWYGPLELWRGPERDVSDILFNGPAGDPFFVVERGARADTGVLVHPSWIAWVQRQLLLRAGKLAPGGAWAGPRAQGVADGMRFLITTAPYSRDGGTLAIRMLPARWRTLDDLVQGATLSRDAAELLLAALEHGASVLVAGATGSGKTTLTAGFTQELGRRHRLIFVEDGGELPRAADSVHLEVSSEEPGAFGRAVKDTLRMKPSYIVVGEVRGGEAMAMLQAAATGHPGIGTIHATNVQGALRNLERMGMLGLAAEAGGGGQSAAAIVRGLITSDAVNLVVAQIGKTARGRRSLLAVEEVLRAGAQGQSGDNFPTNPLFQHDPATDTLRRVGNVVADWGLGRY